MGVRSAPTPHERGRSVRIRPLHHAEDEPLRQVFAGLSQRSRLLRYHSAVPVLSSSMVAALVNIRPGQHVAFAAEIGDGPVGIVRWIRLPGRPTRAELTAEVVDAVQGRGLGRQLAAAAARSALAAGIGWFTLWVNSGNVALRQRLRAVNAGVAVDDPDEFHVPVTTLLPVSRDRTVTPPVLSRFSVDPANLARVRVRDGGRRLRGCGCTRRSCARTRTCPGWKR